MKKQIGFLAAWLSFLAAPALAQKLLIYMDLKQTDHLKAYGVAYWALERGVNIEWLLNYRGGSFMMDYLPELERECRVRGVAFDAIAAGQAAPVYADIEGGNMEVIFLEKAPAIAI